MKTKFPKLVERGRMQEPLDGRVSNTGDTFGAFWLKSPVNGARLFVVVGYGRGWDHVSVSHRNKKRLPTWAEMCWVKSLFFDAEECVMRLHPPASRYVNDTANVLHLWRPQDQDVPQPPIICV